jgi:hypothetical protein
VDEGTVRDVRCGLGASGDLTEWRFVASRFEDHAAD